MRATARHEGRRAGSGGPEPCPCCLRRSWLLAELSAALDYHVPGSGPTRRAARLGDEEPAAGPRRQAAGGARVALCAASSGRTCSGFRAREVCRHHRSYPSATEGSGRSLDVERCGWGRAACDLTAAPTVAIIGSPGRPTTAWRWPEHRAGLAASGVTVASGLSDGIAVAASAGALEVGAGRCGDAGGLDVACAARRRSLYRRATRSGCAVAELPCGARTRRLERWQVNGPSRGSRG